MDIKDEILVGLNVFDIVCFYNYIEFCKMLMNRFDLSLLLDKFDVYGWIIVYYVVMVGNVCVLDYLIKKNNKLIKIKWLKMILYVCCEYGNYEICKKILNYYKEMVFDKDDEDWDVLYYVVKGGKLCVFKEVEKIFK